MKIYKSIHLYRVQTNKPFNPHAYILCNSIVQFAFSFFSVISFVWLCFDWIGWSSVYGFDMSIIAGVAIEEPLVDNCSAEQVVSTSCEILNIDLYSVTKEQLDFESDFTLTAQRNDYIHAYVAYFSVEFSKTNNQIRFFTGPKNQYTHWKQTVFYLSDTLTICKDECITGHISVKRNQHNPRDLDIAIQTTFNGKHQQLQQNTQKYRLR